MATLHGGTLTGSGPVTENMTTARRLTTVWVLGKLIYDTDLAAFYTGDGSTAGGVASGGGGGGSTATLPSFTPAAEAAPDSGTP